ncbi:hypothetical protein V1517DRAFT_311804 [Lipomyces orientalis]|uniref:Uncharacterized protein n=1 Tax=Lipomyces orientalis TaxID=1233043 RepID=A0ACC3TZ29_9ASCO
MSPSSSSLSSDLPPYSSGSQETGTESAFNNLGMTTSTSDSSSATPQSSLLPANATHGRLIADHAATLRDASDWHIPESSRVPFREIPAILISIFGRYRRDSISDIVPDPVSPSGDDDEVMKYDDNPRQLMPIPGDGHAVGEPRLFYSSRANAPFEVFAVKWSGEEIRPGGRVETRDPSYEPDGEDQPLSRDASTSSASTVSDDFEHDYSLSGSTTPEPFAPERKKVSPISKIVSKHFPGHHGHKHRGSFRPTHHTQHTPSAATFRSLIKLQSNAPLRSISPDEWDPQGAYGNIIVSVSAAAGNPAKIYEAAGATGKIWYWIAARLAGHDVLVGVSTFTVYGAYDEDDKVEPEKVERESGESKATLSETAVKEVASAPTEKQLRERLLQDL